MKFFIQLTAFFIFSEFCSTASAARVPYRKRWDVTLQRLPPGEVLTKLDLDRPGLEAVKAAAGKGDQPRALAELLRYYRGKYPPSPVEHATTQQTLDTADRLCPLVTTNAVFIQYWLYQDWVAERS